MKSRRNVRQNCKSRKNKRGGMFYMTNSKKTNQDNYNNWLNRWRGTYEWDPDYNFPGFTNPGAKVTKLDRELLGPKIGKIKKR
jgi:hypothetical protein